MNITDFNATERTETIRSSTPSNDTAIITTKEKLTSEVSSTSDSKSMERVSTSATSVNSGTFETTSVDSSTKTNSISSSWPNDAMTTIITNTKATSNQRKTFDIFFILESMIFSFMLFIIHLSLVIYCTNFIATTASTQSKPTTEPTTPRQLIPLNQVNDTIIGLYNTRAGGSTGGINGTYPPNEAHKYAMDDSPETKYLNFGHKGDPQSLVDEPGIGTGFLVIPSVSNSTLACGLLFTTANDNSYRDPITVTLEGSNATSLTELHLDSSWTLIYNGSTGIDANNSRKTNGTQQNFQNAKRFASYRLLITSKRGVGDAVQYSEARIMGYI
jgi:hypothetical protein